MVKRMKMAHDEPRDAGALALVALRNARIAQVGLLLLALVCLGVDLRDAVAGATALAGSP